MKRSLTLKETVTLTSMLFGMFFGAGNLIFPAKLGIDAGSSIWSAFLGVFVTAVDIPMLAVVALGLSRSAGGVERSIPPARYTRGRPCATREYARA